MTVIANNRVLIKLDEDGNPLGSICDEIIIDENIIDLISGDTCMKLRILRKNFDDVFLMDRKNFDKQKLFEFLNSKNVKISDHEEIKGDVYEYACCTDSSATDVYQHKQLGFVTINDELCFLAHHPIGISEPTMATSTYYDPSVTEPVGTMEGWLDFVNTDIIGHTKLELALALAVLGPVTYFLRTQKVIQTNPAINIAGRSSIGKTTFLRICASVYGSPDETAGLICDLHATENAFSARLAQCHGLPLFCDESTLQPDWDFTKFGYAISKGTDKLRCNQNGSLKEQNKFFSPLIITGETKLLDQTNKNEGLYARFVTITQPLTDSTEQAERITSACSNNYGHAVYPLIEWLLQNHLTLRGVYNEDVNLFKDEVKDSYKGIHSRILKTFSLIITSARIAKLVWNLDINISEMRKFLISIFNEQLPESNRINDLYEKLMAGVVANQSKFYHEDDNKDRFSNNDCWGKFATYKGQCYVWVSTLAVANILKNNGTIDTITLKELDAAGLIKYHSDRYLKQILLGKAKVGCYCFLAKRFEPPSNKKLVKSKLTASKINLLISDDDEEEMAGATDNENP